MKTKQVTYLLAVLVALLAVLLLGSGYIANKLLAHKSAQLSKLKAQSQVAVDLQQRLNTNKQDIVKYAPLNEIAKVVVPQDKSQAQTVGEIVNIASASGIAKLTAITFPASTLGGTNGSSLSGSTLTQVTPVKGIAGVYVLPITVTVDASSPISYSQFLTFLKKLESNRRTAQLSSVSVQPDNKNPDRVSFTLVVNEYIKP
jgi:hypothetical protein